MGGEVGDEARGLDCLSLASIDGGSVSYRIASYTLQLKSIMGHW